MRTTCIVTLNKRNGEYRATVRRYFFIKPFRRPIEMFRKTLPGWGERVKAEVRHQARKEARERKLSYVVDLDAVVD